MSAQTEPDARQNTDNKRERDEPSAPPEGPPQKAPRADDASGPEQADGAAEDGAFVLAVALHREDGEDADLVYICDVPAGMRRRLERLASDRERETGHDKRAYLDGDRTAAEWLTEHLGTRREVRTQASPVLRLPPSGQPITVMFAHFCPGEM